MRNILSRLAGAGGCPIVVASASVNRIEDRLVYIYRQARLGVASRRTEFGNSNSRSRREPYLFRGPLPDGDGLSAGEGGRREGIGLARRLVMD